MSRRSFVLPSLVATMLSIAACHDPSDSSVNATTHEEPTDADSGSTPPADASSGDTASEGARCADATTITATTYVNQHTAADGDRNAVCENVDAPQRFYSFELPAHQRATVHVAPEFLSVIARALASCDATSCLAEAVPASPGDDLTLVIDNVGDSPVTRIISVNAVDAGATATFDIRLDLTPLASGGSAGSTCADATTITATTYVNQHTAADGDRNAVCENVDAPQRFYSFELPAHQRATVHVAPEFLSVIARALASCDATSCLAAAVPASPGDDLTLVIDNVGDSPVTRIISVNAVDAGATATFDIRLDLTPLASGGSAGSTCADATPITATTYVNQHTSTDGDRNAVCENVDAPQRFYSFVLPPHLRATVHVAPELGSIIARALAGCDETSCLTDAVSDAPGGDVTLVIDSPGDEPLTKILSVSSATPGANITFDIRVDLTPLPSDDGV